MVGCEALQETSEVWITTPSSIVNIVVKLLRKTDIIKHLKFAHQFSFSLKSGVRELTATEIDRAVYLERRYQMKGEVGENVRP